MMDTNAASNWNDERGGRMAGSSRQGVAASAMRGQSKSRPLSRSRRPCPGLERRARGRLRGAAPAREESAMAKFPTEVTESVVVPVPLAKAYAFFWNVPTSARCIPGLDRCEGGGHDVFRFVFEERSTGPVSMCVTYTARYTGNGTDEIRFESTGAPEDNTDVNGVVRLERVDADHTRVTVRQMFAPDTPVPRLLQGFIKSFVQSEAAKAAHDYLANVTK